ncbi:MAG: DUF177 domain-containing protein, partial [Desulfovibrio sp.]|nr:DUF177 domain-containing protein [Desulfovibrio sp.]
MTNPLHIPLNDIPANGRDIAVTEKDLWLHGIKEFSMSCQVDEPLTANVSLLPLEGGILVRGTLQGKVLVPCTRCAEITTIAIDSPFE